MNGYSIITPDQRATHLESQGPKILLTGQYGVGKTYTIQTIPKHMKTIVLDIESGLMTVNQWLRTKAGDHVQTIKIGEFQDFLDITVLACGPDKSAHPSSPMSLKGGNIMVRSWPQYQAGKSRSLHRLGKRLAFETARSW